MFVMASVMTLPIDSYVTVLFESGAAGWVRKTSGRSGQKNSGDHAKSPTKERGQVRQSSATGRVKSEKAT